MAKQNWKEFVIGYKNYKKAQGASTKLSESEIADLRNAFTKSLRESKKPVAKSATTKKPVNFKPETLKEAFEGMSNWKANRGLNARLTESEKRAVAEAFRAEKKGSKFAEACKEYKAYKESRGNNAPLTEREKKALAEELRNDAVVSKIREAKMLTKRAERRLAEGDMMGAADMTQQAGNAINDATAMGAAPTDPNAPAPTSPLPQNIVDEIQNIKSAVDALATEAGIESPVNLDADPNAGVPATTGVADPNAPAPAMAESMNSARARIAAREARLAENAATDAMTNLQKTALNGGGDVGVPNGAIASTATKEEVKVPGAQALLKGTVVGPKEAAPAKTWPTRPAKGGESKKLGNIEESAENDSWAERQVEARLAPKFNWNDYLNSKC